MRLCNLSRRSARWSGQPDTSGRCVSGDTIRLWRYVGYEDAKSRCIRINASLPEEMWPEIVKASGYLLNQTPSKNLRWKSPLEDLQISLGRTIIKPDIGHLKVYGCRAYVYIPEEVRKKERHHKLAPRARIGYLVGYQSTNIYRIWIPQHEEVRPEKNVVFNETIFFDPRELNEPEEIITTIEIPTLPITLPRGFISEDLEEGWIIGDSEPSSSSSSSETVPQPQKSVLPPPPTPGMPTPRATPDTQEPVGPPRPSREIRRDVEESNIIVGSRVRKPTEKTGQSYAAFHQAFSVRASHQDPNLHRDRLSPPPRSWYELLRHPHREGFTRAAQTEYDALNNKETFQIVAKSGVPPHGVLPLTWIFDYKFDHNGYLTQYKARICVRGDLQPISEQETYAATVRMKIFRFILALIAAFDLDTWHADVTNAFLNSLLDEEVYCKLPDGFTQPGKCIKLLRALYGLRRAPSL
jgi:hypothetical protein